VPCAGGAAPSSISIPKGVGASVGVASALESGGGGSVGEGDGRADGRGGVGAASCEDAGAGPLRQRRRAMAGSCAPLHTTMPMPWLQVEGLTSQTLSSSSRLCARAASNAEAPERSDSSSSATTDRGRKSMLHPGTNSQKSRYKGIKSFGF
jgi:hypothetical protein